MRNLVWAIGGFIVLIICIFLFANKTKPNNDTIIPTPISVVSPSPNLTNIESGGQEEKKMEVPFQLLKKEEIESKKVNISTNKGDIEIELFSDSPIASSNFIYLINKKFYNGVIFHRVIKGFMIQGGDPNGTGTGGPGYNFPDEKVTRQYERGIVAMANAGPNTNGSQFFIMHQNYQLPPSYTIFGKVTKGIEVVDKIAETPVGQNDKPTEAVTMTSVTLE